MRVEIDLGNVEKILFERARDLAQSSFERQERERARGEFDTRGLLKTVEDAYGHEGVEVVRSKDVRKVVKLYRSSILEGNYSLAGLLRSYFTYLEVMEEEAKSYEEIEASMLQGTREQIEAIKGMASVTAAQVEAAAKRVKNWGVPLVVVAVSYSKVSDQSSPNFMVSLGEGGPGFTVFVDDSGKIEEIEDVLDGGDLDFFHDPMTEQNYFMLIREIRQPGSTSKPGKDLTLYTARPVRDRDLYQDAKTVPPGIFLSSDFDHVEGLAVDLGGSEVRDIWKVRINEVHLMKTLDSGRVKYYQVVSSGPAPVSRMELIAEGEESHTSPRRIAAEWSKRRRWHQN